MLSHPQVCPKGLSPRGGARPPGPGGAYVTCAKAPMCSVIAPPQKKLTGSTTTLSFGLYGWVGGGSGACVWVKPTIAIMEIGGNQRFEVSGWAGVAWGVVAA